MQKCNTIPQYSLQLCIYLQLTFTIIWIIQQKHWSFHSFTTTPTTQIPLLNKLVASLPLPVTLLLYAINGLSF